MAVLIVGVLLCIAAFVFYKRPDIFRLVLPLWLTHPPQMCSSGSFFSTAGESSTTVPPNSWIKTRSESILMCLVNNALSHPLRCITSWALCVFQGYFCCEVRRPLPQTEWEWVHGFQWGIWGAAEQSCCWFSLSNCLKSSVFITLFFNLSCRISAQSAESRHKRSLFYLRTNPRTVSSIFCHVSPPASARSPTDSDNDAQIKWWFQPMAALVHFISSCVFPPSS